MKVAVVCGGPSSEAEVSRVSARSVAAVVPGATTLELDERLAERLLELRPDVVFPVCHGAVGEDGSLQGLLEVLRLPYVGSGVLASALAMDKTAARVHFAAQGLPLAGATVVRAASEAAAIVGSLGPRVVVKPAAGGSALGVTRLSLDEDLAPLEAALRTALEHGPAVLVERFVRGDEVTCGVLDVDDAVALPPTRIESPHAAFYDFESRYAAGKSIHTCPAPYPAERLAAIQRLAVQAHRALGCRDLSRVDFVVSDDAITLLEVNTMPGFTATSLYPEAAATAGVSFSSLCGKLLRSALRRGVAPPARPAPFPKS